MSGLGTSATARTRAAGGGARRRLVVQALEPALDARDAHLAQQRGRRALRRHPAGRGTGHGQDLAVGVEQRHVLRPELLAQALQRQRRRRGARLAQPLGGQAGLAAEVVDERVERAAAQRDPGVERPLHARIEPDLDAARHELVAGGVDEQARQHAHEGEDARQLEQEPAAELAMPQPHDEAGSRQQDHEHQQRGDGDVEPEQPDEVALVEAAPLRGERDDEGEHERETPCPRRAPRSRPSASTFFMAAARPVNAIGGLAPGPGRPQG
jgi:hypothetical protein